MNALPQFAAAVVALLPCGLAQEEDPFAAGGRGLASELSTDQEYDPFSADPPPPPWGSGAPRIQTRVEMIEVSRERHIALLEGDHASAGDRALRTELLALASKGEARIVATMVCASTDRSKAIADSRTEFIYPTEYDPPELAADTGSMLLGEATGPTPSAWDIRHLGPSLTVEPVLDEDTGTVDMELLAEVVRHARNRILVNWRGPHGESHVQMPVFHTLRCHLHLNLIPGEPLLAAILTPMSPDGMADPSRKILVLIQCDLIPASE
jgi:hypothetical protein